MDKHKDKTSQKLEALLARYKAEQRDFEEHWLWKELNTTPKEFFKKVREQVEKSGIEKNVWEQKLKEAKALIETRVREQRCEYKQVNYKSMSGLRV